MYSGFPSTQSLSRFLSPENQMGPHFLHSKTNKLHKPVTKGEKDHSICKTNIKHHCSKTTEEWPRDPLDPQLADSCVYLHLSLSNSTQLLFVFNRRDTCKTHVSRTWATTCFLPHSINAALRIPKAFSSVSTVLLQLYSTALEASAIDLRLSSSDSTMWSGTPRHVASSHRSRELVT